MHQLKWTECEANKKNISIQIKSRSEFGSRDLVSEMAQGSRYPRKRHFVISNESEKATVHKKSTAPNSLEIDVSRCFHIRHRHCHRVAESRCLIDGTKFFAMM